MGSIHHGGGYSLISWQGVFQCGAMGAALYGEFIKIGLDPLYISSKHILINSSARVLVDGINGRYFSLIIAVSMSHG